MGHAGVPIVFTSLTTAAGFLSWFGDLDTLAARLASVTNVEIRRRLRQGLIRRGASPVDKLRELLARPGAEHECAGAGRR